jgi:hypothetical protein
MLFAVVTEFWLRATMPNMRVPFSMRPPIRSTINPSFAMRNPAMPHYPISGRALWFLVTAALLLVAAGQSIAQVDINPNRIIIQSSDPSREVDLRNSGDKPIEVGIQVLFAIWRSDSNGEANLDTSGTPREMALSCARWMKVFPKQFTLQPNSSRKVRILLTPPAGTPDGEYLARLDISNNTLALPNPSADTVSDGITVSVHSVLHLSVPVMFRKGKYQTGLVIGALHAEQREKGTAVFVEAEPTGNAAYRGTLYGVLRDQSGKLVDSVTNAFIAEIPQRLRFDFRKLQSGSYRLTVESQSVLLGTAAETVIRAEPVKGEYDLTASGAGITITPRRE